jgi:hypothetical protein
MSLIGLLMTLVRRRGSGLEMLHQAGATLVEWRGGRQGPRLLDQGPLGERDSAG